MKLVPRGAFADQRRMTAGEINKELDKLEALSGKINDAMIAAGRGFETSSETWKKNPVEDDLTLAYQTVSSRRSDLRNEIARRTGDSRLSRMPKGFGPLSV